MGSGSLVGSGGVTQYGAGRLFVQGPSEFDTDLLVAITDEGIEERRKEEEGVEGMLGPGDWAVYSDQEEVGSLRFSLHFTQSFSSSTNSWLGSIPKGTVKSPLRLFLLSGGLTLPPAYGDVLLYVPFFLLKLFLTLSFRTSTLMLVFPRRGAALVPNLPCTIFRENLT
jgi:hypothetical protein